MIKYLVMGILIAVGLAIILLGLLFNKSKCKCFKTCPYLAKNNKDSFCYDDELAKLRCGAYNNELNGGKRE